MKFLILVTITFATLASAGLSKPKPLAASPAEEAASIHWNQGLNSGAHSWNPERLRENNSEVARPFAETEEAGFLLFHSDAHFSATQIKTTLAQNLPAGVKLFVYTNNSNEIASLKRHYEGLAGKNNVIVAALDYPDSDRAIWARDNTPIPVRLNTEVTGRTWGAVDAVYYGGDEPDSALANWFQIKLWKNPYKFEGGNFVADEKGNCLVVNKVATASIPDSVFTGLYGCKNLVRLKHVAGIGHADERVKFINNKTILTDTPSYVTQLSQLGYEVVLLPQPQLGKYRTYVNSLLVNGKVFVPVFDETNDEEALAVYRSQGLEVFPVNSETLSDHGNGSVHCITMTYPKMDVSELKRLLFQ
jgi:agmatine/peptidylarginine deiminase